MAYHSYTASLLTHYNYKKTNSTKAKLYKKAHSHYLPEIPEYNHQPIVKNLSYTDIGRHINKLINVS